MSKYIGIVDGNDKDGYSGYVANLNGSCLFAGSTMDELVRDANESVVAHIEFLMENDFSLQPDSIDLVIEDDQQVIVIQYLKPI